MTTPDSRGDREKVVSKLPSWLRQELKVRAVQHGIDMQDAVEAGITAWRALGSNLSPIDTSGAESFATFLPGRLWTGFRSDCKLRGFPSSRAWHSPYGSGWTAIPLPQ